MVIKSLDHWPDLGSDVDLLTDASPSAVINLMRTKFQAEVADRSWGDRLANKWNFNVPGLPEAIEIRKRKDGADRRTDFAQSQKLSSDAHA